MRLMLGELNSSHVGYGSPHRGDGEATGWIGALFDPEAGGPGIRVREVLPDSPAARLDVENVVAHDQKLTRRQAQPGRDPLHGLGRGLRRGLIAAHPAIEL